MTSLKKRYEEVGIKDLLKAQNTSYRSKGNLADYDKVFPIPEGQKKYISQIPHPNKEPHKKCCDVCYAARSTHEMRLATFNMETFYCVHRLVDGKHQPCAAYSAYKKAGKLKKKLTKRVNTYI